MVSSSNQKLSTQIGPSSPRVFRRRLDAQCPLVCGDEDSAIQVSDSQLRARHCRLLAREHEADASKPRQLPSAASRELIPYSIPTLTARQRRAAQRLAPMQASRPRSSKCDVRHHIQTRSSLLMRTLAVSGRSLSMDALESPAYPWLQQPHDSAADPPLN